MSVRILVIDDRLSRDESQKRALRRAFALLEDSCPGLSLSIQFESGQRQQGKTLVNDVQSAIAAVDQDPLGWALVLLDMQFDQGELNSESEAPHPDPRFGLKIERKLLELHPALPVVRFTTSHEKDLDGTASPPFLSKLDTFSSADEGAAALRSVLVRYGNLPLGMKSSLLRVLKGTVIGSQPMLAVYEQAYRYAQLEGSNILVRGASGSGKENLARYIHSVSRLANGPFVARNVAAISSELFESEMFGVERGAAAGVIATTDGEFIRAAGGTLLLDELGTAKREHQAKLLRVIDERSFRRVGNGPSIRLNCNLIAATQDNVEQRATGGDFRSDLLNRFPLVLFIPEISERREEIPKLTLALLEREMIRQGKQGMELSSEVVEQLMRHPLPKNVRSIQEGLMRAVSKRSSNGLVRWEDLELDAEIPDTERLVRNKCSLKGGRQVPAANTSLEATSLDELPRGGSKESRKDLLIAQLNMLKGFSVSAAVSNFPELLAALKEADLHIRRELAYAALERCRHPNSRRIKVRPAMILLTGQTMGTTRANSVLSEMLGLKKSAKLDHKRIAEELDRRFSG